MSVSERKNLVLLTDKTFCRLLAPWLSPCYGFSAKTWLMLLVTYTMFTIALLLISWCDLGQSPILGATTLTVLKLVIQQPIPRKDLEKYFTSKTLLIPAILATMVINIAYTGGYASVMTKPIYENAINTLDDFLNSDLSWGSFHMAEWIKVWKKERTVSRTLIYCLEAADWL